MTKLRQQAHTVTIGRWTLGWLIAVTTSELAITVWQVAR